MSYEALINLSRKGGFTLPVELIDAVANRAKEYAAASELRRSCGGYDGSQQALLNADAIRAAENVADRADDRVRNYMRINQDTIVVEHLRPSFEAVLAEVRKTCPKDCPTTAEAALRAPNGSRDYLKLQALADRYSAVMSAAQVIYGAGGRDSHRMFADTLTGPDRNSVQYQYVQPRGPAAPMARLLWLAHEADANPHLPTIRERDLALDGFTRQAASIDHSRAVN